MRLILSILFISASFISLKAQKKEDITARMKSDISYLASDQLEGRLTGSSGELRSSLHIADQFRINAIRQKCHTLPYFIIDKYVPEEEKKCSGWQWGRLLKIEERLFKSIFNWILSKL